MGYPNTCDSIEGVLVWGSMDHVLIMCVICSPIEGVLSWVTEEDVLSGSYVYVHRLRVSSRVHMGRKGSVRNICVFVYITYFINIYILYIQEVYI
jgi:hypothetical protein